jgi:hypothetical protein
LARALPWHGRGGRFKSGKVHQNKNQKLVVVKSMAEFYFVSLKDYALTIKLLIKRRLRVDIIEKV